MEYLDFELEIGPGSGQEYPVSVVHSPAGEARATLRFPLSALELENALDKLRIALLTSGVGQRRVQTPEAERVQAFGQLLFEALLPGEIRSRYDMSWRDAQLQGKGLRLKLRCRAPELAALPWEFLYDPRLADYVNLSQATPLVRYPEVAQPIQPLAVTPPLRILGMVATPSDLPELDVSLEKQRVEAALREAQAAGRVALTWLEGQSWRALQRALREGPWHAFHLIGHGGFDRAHDEGYVALADEEGYSARLSATELVRLLGDHAALRLVVLNTCEGAAGSAQDSFASVAATLARRIPAVLAMQYPISDRAAIEFARDFYEALAEGCPVDMAVAEARKAVSVALKGTLEWGTPALYLRAPDGRLFNVQALPPDTSSSPKAETHPPTKAASEPHPPAQSAPTASEPRQKSKETPGEETRARPEEFAEGLKARVQAFEDQRRVMSDRIAETDARHRELTARLSEALNSTHAAPEPQAEKAAVPALPQPTLLYTLKGHTGAVQSVAFSPDGALLASGAGDNTVRLWRMHDGAAERTLKGHKRLAGMLFLAGVYSVTFSPDGTLLASGAVDETIRLWRVADGTTVRIFKSSDASSMAFSPDGTLLAANSVYGMDLLQLADGTLVRHYPTGDSVQSVAFSPDGTLLACGTNGSFAQIQLWRVAEGGKVRTWGEYERAVQNVAFSPDGALLASGSGDKTVRLWRVAEGQEFHTLRGHTGEVRSIAFSPDGTLLASGSWDTTVRLWRVADGSAVCTLRGHTRAVQSVAFSSDGTLLASGSEDSTLSVWRL